jgi:hypothetical protein
MWERSDAVFSAIPTPRRKGDARTKRAQIASECSAHLAGADNEGVERSASQGCELFLDPPRAPVCHGAVAQRLSERLDALSEADGSAQLLVGHRAGPAAFERGPIRIAHLTKDLLLGEDGGVEPAGDQQDPLRRGQATRAAHGTRDIAQAVGCRGESDQLDPVARVQYHPLFPVAGSRLELGGELLARIGVEVSNRGAGHDQTVKLRATVCGRRTQSEASRQANNPRCPE